MADDPPDFEHEYICFYKLWANLADAARNIRDGDDEELDQCHECDGHEIGRWCGTRRYRGIKMRPYGRPDIDYDYD